MTGRIKRIYGKGYENRNVIVRKRKGGGTFFLFLCLFGAVIYLLATALFRALSVTEAWRSLSFLF